MLKIRVGVLEQHAIVRYGLCKHVAGQPQLALAGVYNNAEGILDSVRQDRLDVLLVGHLIDQDPSQCVEALSQKYPRLKILALLNHPHAVATSLLLARGAHGVLYKTQPLQAYAEAILAVGRGERYCEYTGLS
ncbi:hypothetical protein BLX41_31825 [Pseudomonas protegens]|uniref:response regulator transcription factor n=1 Tax=Pseudomonas protegens TaxID=380021 RepID=UPI000F4BC255|nr:response regulator transcription factor [Pseudomonas protegens]ROL62672.1 hypothetical protein BLX41_31825 [Pseudomonas protegens]